MLLLMFLDRRAPSRLYQSSKVLDGFCLALKTDKPNERYKIPDIPSGYKPQAAVTGVSQLPKLYGKLDKTLRGLIIGEAVQGRSCILYLLPYLLFVKFSTSYVVQ